MIPVQKIKKITALLLLFVLSITDAIVPVVAAQANDNNLIGPKVSEKQQANAAPQKQVIKKSMVNAARDIKQLTLADMSYSFASARQRLAVSVQELAKDDFKADEVVSLTVNNPDRDTFSSKVVNMEGEEVPVEMRTIVRGSETEVLLAGTNQFVPGKLTLEVKDSQGNTSKQDFTWGVLALNTDKAIYKPQETAAIAMAVLDDKGEMVCDAQVELRITNHESRIDEVLSTANGKIVINEECTSKEFTLKPDYETTYVVGAVGTYAMELTAITGNGSYTISESFAVKESVPFDVKRTSATRLYPPLSYPMNIEVTASEDFEGTVTETVPDSFIITPSGENETYDGLKTLYLDGQSPEAGLESDVLGASASSLQMPFDGKYSVSQGYGVSLTDINLRDFYAKYGLAGHDGIDFALPMGTQLYAVDDGNVIFSGPGDYGITIIIQHSWGRSYYGHLSKTNVGTETHVPKGTLIGYSGNTGESTGPHLHFGMKPEKHDLDNGFAGKVDPLPYLHSLGAQTLAEHLPTGIHSAGVLSASTSAEAAQGTIASAPEPPVEVQNIALSPVADASSSAKAEPFTVLSQEIQGEIAASENAVVEKVKVIKWKVSLKKGEKKTLSYTYKTPQVSPQFYLSGPLKLFDAAADTVVYEESRKWQLAADAVGVDWYDYSWIYRKSITIDKDRLGTSVPLYDQAANGGVASGTSLSWTHTVGAGLSNTILIVGFTTYTNGASVAVTYGGAPLTKLTSVLFNGSGYQHVWYLLNPPAGASTVAITGGSLIVTGGSASYYNVSQTTPFGTSSSASGSSTTPSVTVTSTTAQLVIDSLGVNTSGTLTAGAGQTATYNNNAVAGSHETGGATSTVMSWTVPSGAWGIVGVPLNGGPVSQTDFPVLINLTTDPDLSAKAQLTGNDILFTDSMGKVKLSHEIETYTSGTGALVAWVKVPALSGTADTEIYMYYGNPSAVNQETVTSVWDTSYRAVYHMNFNPTTATSPNGCNGATAEVCDSTTNANHGDSVGTMTSGDVVASQIGSGIDFDGTDDGFQIPDTGNTLDVANITLSAWVRRPVTGTSDQIVGRQSGTGGSDLYQSYISNLENYFFNGTPIGNLSSSSAAGDLNTWVYVTHTYDGATKSFYKNGAFGNSNSFVGAINSDTSNLCIASGANDATKACNNEFLRAIIDEVRVSSIARSATWIATEYNNQSSPGTFYAVGTPEETEIYAPTNDELMRHGKFFDGRAAEQPFVF